MENGELRMENGEWRIENGELRMENGECSIRCPQFRYSRYRVP